MTVKGLTTPRRVGCVELFFCRYEGLACSLLLDWYLGSQKLREILTLLCCITLSSSREKPMHAQEVARRISGAIAGEVFTQVNTYQVPITKSSPSHYIVCHLPLVFLSPTSPLPFYSPFFRSPSSRMYHSLCFHVPSICLCLCLLKIYWYGST